VVDKPPLHKIEVSPACIVTAADYLFRHAMSPLANALSDLVNGYFHFWAPEKNQHHFVKLQT